MYDIRPESPKFFLHTSEVSRKRHVEAQILLHWNGDKPRFRPKYLTERSSRIPSGALPWTTSKGKSRIRA